MENVTEPVEQVQSINSYTDIVDSLGIKDSLEAEPQVIESVHSEQESLIIFNEDPVVSHVHDEVTYDNSLHSSTLINTDFCVDNQDSINNDLQQPEHIVNDQFISSELVAETSEPSALTETEEIQFENEECASATVTEENSSFINEPEDSTLKQSVCDQFVTSETSMSISLSENETETNQFETEDLAATKEVVTPLKNTENNDLKQSEHEFETEASAATKEIMNSLKNTVDNDLKQSEHEFETEDLAATKEIVNSLKNTEGNDLKQSEHVCNQPVSSEVVTETPINSSINLSHFKKEVHDSSVKENVDLTNNIKNSDLKQSEHVCNQLVLSEPGPEASSSLEVNEAEMKQLNAQQHELAVVEEIQTNQDTEFYDGSSQTRVIVNDNVLIPINDNDQTVIGESEEHFIVKEDGTVQKLTESEMHENGICVSLDQDHFENENAVLVIEEISSSEVHGIHAETEETIIIRAHETVQDIDFIGGGTVMENIEAEEVDSPDIVVVENYESQDKSSEVQGCATKTQNKNKTTSIPDKIITDKGKSLKIPAHVLGRNIDNPVNDMVSNGRLPPKPRLGVKIPYRNLTSQIVSKQEIENVIMERSRLRNATHDPPIGGDLFFAKKLTQRLARKLAPNSSEESKKEKKISQSTSKKIMKSYNTRIENDSDLLAILEGDGDELVKTTSAPEKKIENVTKMDPEREKFIALKQLKQLPKRKKGDDSFGIENIKNVSKELQQTVEVQKPANVLKKSDKVQEGKKETLKKDEKLIGPKESTSKSKSSSKDESVVESRFASNVPLKTYARKRKFSDDKIILLEDLKDADSDQVEIKVETNLPPDAYITKSSRVIKKKIIWDPDEAATSRYNTKVSNVLKQVGQVIKSNEKKNEKPTEKRNDKQLEKKPDKSPEKKIEKQVDDKMEKLESKVEKKTVKQSEQKAEQKVQNSPEKKMDKLRKSNEKPTDKKISKIPEKKNKMTVLRKKHKRLTEVDKLLMDEGAVNMLYDVKNLEDQLQCKPTTKKHSVISLDKAQRELLNKANEIKNDLESNSNKESPKSLRKKDSPTAAAMSSPNKDLTPEVITRKKSRDSVRSSVHTPPASPSYAFPQHAEASRIIRRHSSSSFSSDEESEETSNSMEKQPERVTRKRAANALSESTKTKKIKRNQASENLSVTEKNKLNEEMTKNFNNLVASSDSDYTHFKTLSVETLDKLVQVTLNVSKKECTLSVEAIKELCKILNLLQSDDSCHAVVLNSAGKSFCRGIDYQTLVSDTEEVRMKKATEMATSIGNFLKCLANFSKVITAGVHGDVIGLGVTMLPLFDMVLASDDSTFSTPYARLGCVAEGGLLLTLPHLTNNFLASELIFASQNLTSDEAVQKGLVTRTIWREKFSEELNTVSVGISNNSRQSMEVTKKLLRQHVLPIIEEAINMEKTILIQHWTSKECQKNFSTYSIK